MSREDPQMKIRLPFDLKSRIERLAILNGRSMNAEIVFRLQQLTFKSDVLSEVPNAHLMAFQQLSRRYGIDIEEQIISIAMKYVFEELDQEHAKFRVGMLTFEENDARSMLSYVDELRSQIKDRNDVIDSLLFKIQKILFGDDVRPVDDMAARLDSPPSGSSST